MWYGWGAGSAFRDFTSITEIYMLGRLKGVIPDSFTKLTALRSLSLVDTAIYGTLPINMGDMTGLQMIWLDHNPSLGGKKQQ